MQIGISLGVTAMKQGGGGQPPKLSKLATKIAAVDAANSGLVRVLHLGDSTTHGYGAGTSGGARAGAQANAYPAKLATHLASKGKFAGYRQSTDAIMGASDENGVTYPTYDPRVTFGTGWSSTGGSNPCLGGGLFSCNNTGLLGFSPQQDFDTVELYFATDTAGANGIGQVQIGNGPILGTFNCNATSSVQKLTLSNVHATGAADIGAINVSRQTGTIIYIVGIVAYNSAIKTVIHVNAGWGGATSTTYARQNLGYNPKFGVERFSPDFTIINLGINDRRTGVANGTFKTNVQVLATSALVSGDIAFIAPWSSGISQVSQSAQDSFQPVYTELSAANDNAPIYDLYARYGAYTAWDPTYGFHDNLHPATTGYADEAVFIGDLILSQVIGTA